MTIGELLRLKAALSLDITPPSSGALRAEISDREIAILKLLLLSKRAGGGLAVGPDYYFASDGNDLGPGTELEPLASIAKANTLILNPGDQLLFKRGEIYPGTLNTNRSGAVGNPIIVDGYGDSPDRAVLSGGVKVQGWVLYDAPKKIWRAPFAAALGRPRQIWVDGRLCKRSNTSSFIPSDIEETETGYDTTDSTDPGWLSDAANPGDIEFVYTEDWTESRVQVSGVSGNVITMSPVAFTLHKGFLDNFAPILGWSRMPSAIENSREMFEYFAYENTFYQDRSEGYVYVKPPFYVSDPNDVEVWAGVREQIIQLSGVSNISFGPGVELSHTTCLLPFSSRGFSNLYGPANNSEIYTTTLEQHTMDADVLSAAALITNCENITFTRTLCRRLAGNGIHFQGTSAGCKTIGIIGHEVGGNTVVYGRPGQPLSEEAPYDLEIKNSVFQVNGTEFRCAGAGTFGFYAQATILEHCLSRYQPYDGFAEGWGWYSVLINANIGNRARFNRAHDVMLYLGDGAGIYTNGTMVDKRIENNWIDSVIASPIAIAAGLPTTGIYADNGSDDVLIKGNVVSRTGSDTRISTNDNRGGGTTIEDNTIDHAVIGGIHDYDGPGSTPPTISGTIVAQSEDCDIAGAALGAGLELAFADVQAEADALLNLAYDKFTAPDGTLLHNRHPSPVTAGIPWTTQEGSAANQTIFGNQGRLISSGGVGEAVRLTNSGVIDFTMTGTIQASAVGVGSGFGIRFRKIDVNNYWIAFFTGLSSALYRVIAGVSGAPIQNVPAGPLANTAYNFRLTLREGFYITIELAGVATLTAEDSTHESGREVSIYGLDSTVLFDEVKIFLLEAK